MNIVVSGLDVHKESTYATARDPVSPRAHIYNYLRVLLVVIWTLKLENTSKST
jgi:hypothetical protein